MPLYVYECRVCKQPTEKLELHSAETVRDCDICGSIKSAQRVIAPTSFTLAGAGWYKDSYKTKS